MNFLKKSNKTILLKRESRKNQIFIYLNVETRIQIGNIFFLLKLIFRAHKFHCFENILSKGYS